MTEQPHRAEGVEHDAHPGLGTAHRTSDGLGIVVTRGDRREDLELERRENDVGLDGRVLDVLKDTERRDGRGGRGLRHGVLPTMAMS
jgi:hypothetical protein